MAAISGLIGMILPYVIIGVLVYMAWRWFVGRAKAAAKALAKGAKVAGKAAIKGGKAVSNADDNLLKTKKGKVVYGATMLIPGVGLARGGKAIYRKAKYGKFGAPPPKPPPEA